MATVCTVLAAAWFGTAAAVAVNIQGSVRDVNGDAVTVVIEGEMLPSAGDKADIFFKLAGGDDEVAVAAGTVTGEEAGAIKVTIKEGQGSPGSIRFAEPETEIDHGRSVIISFARSDSNAE
jgi:hypothetical protein